MSRIARNENRPSSQNPERRVQYSPPSEVDLPKDLIRKFEDNGFHLRWVRVLLGNDEDFRNVARRKREGYEFVKKEEIGDEFGSFELDKFKDRNIVVIGDLALMKLPIDNKERREEYYSEEASSQVKAAKKEMFSNPSKNMPVFDESYSQVVGVKNARFKTDE